MDTIIELGKVTEETKGDGKGFIEVAPPDDCDFTEERDDDAGCG
jgi:hypothetical protein